MLLADTVITEEAKPVIEPIENPYSKPVPQPEIKPVVIPEVTNGSVAPVNPEVKAEFSGIIVTSDKMGAGTDAGVDVWLTDTNGKTVGPITVREDRPGEYNSAMERGKTDDIVIRLTEDFGKLYKIAVRQDGKKAADEWHLDRIELGRTDGATDERDVPFVFKKWLKAGKIYEAGRNELAPIRVRNRGVSLVELTNHDTRI